MFIIIQTFFFKVQPSQQLRIDVSYHKYVPRHLSPYLWYNSKPQILFQEKSPTQNFILRTLSATFFFSPVAVRSLQDEPREAPRPRPHKEASWWLLEPLWRVRKIYCQQACKGFRPITASQLFLGCFAVRSLQDKPREALRPRPHKEASWWLLEPLLRVRKI